MQASVRPLYELQSILRMGCMKDGCRSYMGLHPGPPVDSMVRVHVL